MLPSLLQYFDEKVQQFEGGQLLKYYDNWKLLTSDSEILNIIAGDHIEFKEVPPSKHSASNCKMDAYSYALLHKEINQLIKTGIIVPSVHEKTEFISPIFTVPKQEDDTFRRYD